MSAIDLKINGKVVARVDGTNFTHVPGDRARWFGYEFFELLAGTEWLRFEVEPETADDAPSDMALAKADRRRSSLVFQSKLPESGEFHANGFTFNFFWRNPLTPGSRGLWLQLTLRLDAQFGLIVVTKKDTTIGAPASRIWSWHEGSEWKDERFSIAPDDDDSTWKMTGLQQRLNRLPYAQKGTGCTLLTRGDDRAWLVDASGVDDLRERFRLDFLPPDNKNKCRLAAVFTAPPGRYAVNARALSAEDHSSVAIDATAINLVCARMDDRSGFLVEWSGVSSAAAPGSPSKREALSLNTLYQALARHYTLGLAAARSRNRLSFAPTSLHTQKVRLHFAVASEAGPTRVRSIIVDQNASVTWTTGAASETGPAPVDVTITQSLFTPAFKDFISANPPAPFLLDILQTKAAEDAAITGGWIVNGVAVNVTKFDGGQLRLKQEPGADRYGQSPAQIDLQLDFSAGTIVPRSDDPEIGFETISSAIGRERPTVIDLIETPNIARVEIREFATAEQSRVLRIGIRNAAAIARDFTVDAVVLDPSPLTLARVSSTASIPPGAFIAEYSDDSDQPPEWTFTSAEGDMQVTLPPQVIGEEMIKGRLHIGGTAVPSPDKPFDFRLSPPARLTLDRTDIDTARTVAPWSLRRLLGQRPAVVGAKLQRAQFELLYGLLSTIDGVPGLRVAELDALVGRLPFPDAFLDLLKNLPDHEATAEQQELRRQYSDTIKQHIRALLYRPSWWPVFRDFTSRQQLTVSGKGVSAALRPQRATAHPFEIARFHDLVAHTGDTMPPLRGGVDWPFQSPKVYEELLREPDTSSLSISGLAFGSLGGFGRQTAEFNNGKTLIISETTQGRLDSVTVIRIGRIAMLWNRARHVIVYERTTRRAPRYADDLHAPAGDTWEYQAPAFDGLAALRKVREYIEITEQVRRYPDTSASRPIAGPLRASFFETTIIPVKSSWGYDVASGFVIGLRGPLTANEERFFPFPKIFLKKARARSKGEGTVDHQLTHPGELLFYTSTRPEDGGDTDRWAAVPDIDFPLLTGISKPPLPFRSHFTSSPSQPDARPSEFGQSRFTITLDTPEEAVDLMHGRASEGIDAHLSTVSFARGRSTAQLENLKLDNGTAQTLVDAMSDGHALIHEGLSELQMQVAHARANGAQAIAEIAGFRGEALALAQSLKERSAALVKQLPAVPSPFNWKTEQEQWTSRFQANLERQRDAWKPQLKLPDVAGNEIVRLGRSALEHVCQQAHQRLDEVGFLPLVALERIDAAAESIQKRTQVLLDGVLTEFDAALDRIASRRAEMIESGGPAAVDEEGGDGEDTSHTAAGLITLNADLDAALLGLDAAFARFDADNAKYVTDALGSWFSAGNDGLIDALTALAGPVLAEARAAAAGLSDSMPPLEYDEPDWNEVKAGARAIVADLVDALNEKVIAEIDVLRNELANLRDPKTGRLKVVDAAHVKLEQACTTASNALATSGQKALDDFVDAVERELKAIGTPLGDELTKLQNTAWGKAPGLFDHANRFKTDAQTWFGDLEQKLADAVSFEEAEREIQAIGQKIASALEGTGRQVERFIVDKARGLVAPIEIDANGIGLELTRVLATGPINDTIACTRERLGYYYDAAKEALDVTPAAALFNELGASVLNPLAIELPFDKIRDRLLPQLNNLNLSQLLPSFGGLKLEHLFPDLKAPDDGDENDWVRIRHGFDKDRLTAFADVTLDKVIDGEPAVFVLPPVSLKLREAHFAAHSRLEVAASGSKSQTTTGSIAADWMLCLSERPLVTLKEAMLLYDSNGGFDFAFDSENVELAPEFDFITNALKSLLPQEEGLTLTPIMPAGIRAELGLPLPDLTTGAFTLTGITLYTYMELLIADGFEVRTGFWLSKPERPFGLAILFLGGGGWLGTDVSYRPPDRFVTRVSIGISAGAFVAINFGVARGSAGILFTVGVDFYRDWATQGGRTVITLGIIVWGEFSILCIASASLRLTLSVSYDGSTGTMIGRGRVEVRIKICWCFTLSVSASVSQTFAGGEKKKALGSQQSHTRAVTTVNKNLAL